MSKHLIHRNRVFSHVKGTPLGYASSREANCFLQVVHVVHAFLTGEKFGTVFSSPVMSVSVGVRDTLKEGGGRKEWVR